MAKLLVLDVESSGVDVAKDKIIELAYVLWDTDTHKPLLIKSDLIVHLEQQLLSSEIVNLTGIDQDILISYGLLPYTVLENLIELLSGTRIDYIVGHNLIAFDAPIIEAEMTRNGVVSALFMDFPKLDTRYDLPYPDSCDSRKLKHLAGDHGFVPIFPHRALFDVLTTIKILDQYDFNEILKYKEIPWVTVRAMVSFQDKDLAKARKYSWEKLGDKTYPKCWVKMIKEDQLEKEKKEAGFEISKLV